MRTNFYLALLSLLLVASCQSDDDDGDEVTTIYVSNIEIEGENIIEGIYGQMNAIITPEDATDRSITWGISNETIATISSGGLIKAEQNGTVTVTATADDRGTVKATKDITISSFDEELPRDGINYVVSNPAEFLEALSVIKAEDSIFMNEGTYTFNSTIGINASGNSEVNIYIGGQEGQERPTLDFSSMSENSSNRGIQVNGSYWYIHGIDVFGAGDNGMFIKGNSNLIEFCTFSENSDTGLQLGNGAANNTILNCDSFYNADSTLENADGFASKLDAGTGNKFIGCRAWNNLDDGWDGYLRGADGITTTHENCWAINNGYLKNGTPGAGDGNGFKTGGSDDKLLKHNAVYTNCIAVGNIYDGFDHNSNRGNVEIYNCSAYNNGRNYSFSNTNPLANLIIKNSLALGDYGSTNATAKNITHNSWQDGISVTESDFKSIDYTELLAARKSDGSLPDVNYFHLNSDSDLIDKGIDVGLPYNGSAPDLGSFEFE